MDQIEEIKSKIDIVSLISNYLPLKKAGRNFKTRCPFHQEKTPSFIISPELQIFKCFGCGQAGDAIKFLQLYEKMDFWEAAEFLAQRAGVKLAKRRISGDEQIKKRLYEMNHLAAEFYHFLLTGHKVGEKALNYILKRGISKESVNVFQLGFSPDKPGVIVNFLEKKGYSIAEILQTGIIFPTRGNNYLDRFRQRLVFPLFDHRGNVVGFSGRVVPRLSPEKTAKYINVPETKLYRKRENLYGLWQNRDFIRKKKEVVVVEGEIDVISAYQAGLKSVVAIKGTAFTEEQARLIQRFAETAVLALDADSAGTEAIKRSSQIADAIGLDVKVAVIPEGFKDLDDLIQKKPGLLKGVIKKPEPIWDFIIDLAFKKHDSGDPSGKRRILNEVLPFLGGLENEVIKNHYLQKLAGGLGVNLESVLLELEKVKNKTAVKDQRQKLAAGVAPPSSRRYLLEKYLLTLIFLKEEWSWLKDKSWFYLISSPVLKKIIKLAHKFIGKKKKLVIKDFFLDLPGELKPGFEEIYLTDKKQEFRESKEKIEVILTDLKTDELRRQLNDLSLGISQSEKRGDSKKTSQLEKKFVKISHQLAILEKD